MLTFGLFCLGYATMSLLFGAKIAYIVMVPVSFVLVSLAVARFTAGMVFLSFAAWAAKNEDKMADTIVVQARGLDK